MGKSIFLGQCFKFSVSFINCIDIVFLLFFSASSNLFIIYATNKLTPLTIHADSFPKTKQILLEKIVYFINNSFIC